MNLVKFFTMNTEKLHLSVVSCSCGYYHRTSIEALRHFYSFCVLAKINLKNLKLFSIFVIK